MFNISQSKTTAKMQDLAIIAKRVELSGSQRHWEAWNQIVISYFKLQNTIKARAFSQALMAIWNDKARAKITWHTKQNQGNLYAFDVELS